MNAIRTGRLAAATPDGRGSAPPTRPSPDKLERDLRVILHLDPDARCDAAGARLSPLARFGAAALALIRSPVASVSLTAAAAAAFAGGTVAFLDRPPTDPASVVAEPRPAPDAVGPAAPPPLIYPDDPLAPPEPVAAAPVTAGRSERSVVRRPGPMNEGSAPAVRTDRMDPADLIRSLPAEIPTSRAEVAAVRRELPPGVEPQVRTETPALVRAPAPRPVSELGATAVQAVPPPIPAKNSARARRESIDALLTLRRAW